MDTMNPERKVEKMQSKTYVGAALELGAEAERRTKRRELRRLERRHRELHRALEEPLNYRNRARVMHELSRVVGAAASLRREVGRG